ncbi:MAG: ferredoxin, partial [Eubacteriales bacterium]
MPVFETRIQEIKTTVLTEVAKLAWENQLNSGTNMLDIAEKVSPGNRSNIRCCIYKERAIVQSRIRLALGGNEEDPNIVEVLPITTI